jgi:hypothetical protein
MGSAHADLVLMLPLCEMDKPEPLRKPPQGDLEDWQLEW